MSAIDNLLGKIAGLSGNKNVAFVFDTKQYEPVVLTCTPSDVLIVGDINDPVDPEQYYSFRYRLSGDISQPEVELTFLSNAPTKSDLFVDMVFAINTHYLDLGQGVNSNLIAGASGGIANFSTLIVRDGIYGGDGSAGGLATTLHLLPSTAENDAVLTLFDSAVSVSSCGYEAWPGV